MGKLRIALNKVPQLHVRLRYGNGVLIFVSNEHANTEFYVSQVLKGTVYRTDVVRCSLAYI